MSSPSEKLESRGPSTRPTASPRINNGILALMATVAAYAAACVEVPNREFDQRFDAGDTTPGSHSGSTDAYYPDFASRDTGTDAGTDASVDASTLDMGRIERDSSLPDAIVPEMDAGANQDGSVLDPDAQAPEIDAEAPVQDAELLTDADDPIIDAEPPIECDSPRILQDGECICPENTIEACSVNPELDLQDCPRGSELICAENNFSNGIDDDCNGLADAADSRSVDRETGRVSLNGQNSRFFEFDISFADQEPPVRAIDRVISTVGDEVRIFWVQNASITATGGVLVCFEGDAPTEAAQNEGNARRDNQTIIGLGGSLDAPLAPDYAICNLQGVGNPGALIQGRPADHCAQ